MLYAISIDNELWLYLTVSYSLLHFASAISIFQCWRLGANLHLWTTIISGSLLPLLQLAECFDLSFLVFAIYTGNRFIVLSVVY